MGKKNNAVAIGIVVAVLLTLGAMFIASSAESSSVSVDRTMPTVVHAEKTFDVVLEIDIINEANPPKGLIINEYVPVEWVIEEDASPSYTSYDNTTGEINWVLFEKSGIKDRDITYTVNISESGGEPKIFEVRGVWFAANETDTIGGDTEVLLVEKADVIVERELPSTVSAGSHLDVTLNMGVNESNLPAGVIITEIVPEGWAVTSGEVKWVFNGLDVKDRTIEYTVLVPLDAEGKKSFEGMWNITGNSGMIAGDSKITVEKVPSFCFIATAAYGTPLHEDINVLRDFRDEHLMTNPAGEEFVRVYYATSPPIAGVISENEWLRTIVREGLVKPLVYIVRVLD